MMKRSQIYLPAEQWRLLSSLSHRKRSSVSELIRRALDKVYTKSVGSDFELALSQAAGLWRDRRDLPSTGAHLRALRKSSRLQRLYGRHA